MKKFTVLFIFCSLILIGGCKSGVDYSQFISEMRYGVYLYSDDATEIKIYRGDKETPYCADGIRGNVSPLTEIFVTLPKNYGEVEISAGGVEGEMNFRAVENCYYLSSSDWNQNGDSVEVTLTCDGETHSFTAANVMYDGVMNCESALRCVVEHDKALFENMTENGTFKGEIFIRLLYDEGCYYYVGVCDRNKTINAYLVDGEKGKIISTKKLQG